MDCSVTCTHGGVHTTCTRACMLAATPTRQRRDRPSNYYYCYYYVLLRHNGSKTYSSVHTHTVIHANTSTKNTIRFLKKQLKTVKRNRTGKTRATLGLLYCAGECVPYSLLYRLPADVSRRQTVQTANSNKSTISARQQIYAVHSRQATDSLAPSLRCCICHLSASHCPDAPF